MSAYTSSELNSRWDRAGVLLSGLCAIHCLALPIALLVVPCTTSGAALHEFVHPAMAALLVPATLRAARGSEAAPLLYAGLVLVWLGVAGHLVLGECVGLFLTLAGSGALIHAHRCNLRTCHAEVGCGDGSVVGAPA